jgi:hypothetical protein
MPSVFIIATVLLAGAEAVKIGKKHHHNHHNKQHLAQGQYEPAWGLNSGNSYNNGPFTNFYSGYASPYSAISTSEAQTSAPQSHAQVASSNKYEPSWGLNSGNSYNNGPFTDFYHGYASPYSVISTSEVQLDDKMAYEPSWGLNSGNSYNNGPFTDFYHGYASPYSVIKEDGTSYEV